MHKSMFAKLALAGIAAGGLSLTACDHNGTSGNNTQQTTGITAASTLQAFQEECAKLGHAYAPHDCQGHNTCKGHSYQEGKGVAKHDCSGKSACQGGSCVEPAAT